MQGSRNDASDKENWHRTRVSDQNSLKAVDEKRLIRSQSKAKRGVGLMGGSYEAGSRGEGKYEVSLGYKNRVKGHC